MDGVGDLVVCGASCACVSRVKVFVLVVGTHGVRRGEQPPLVMLPRARRLTLYDRELVTSSGVACSRLGETSRLPWVGKAQCARAG